MKIGYLFSHIGIMLYILYKKYIFLIFSFQFYKKNESSLWSEVNTFYKHLTKIWIRLIFLCFLFCFKFTVRFMKFVFKAMSIRFCLLFINNYFFFNIILPLCILYNQQFAKSVKCRWNRVLTAFSKSSNRFFLNWILLHFLIWQLQ